MYISLFQKFINYNLVSETFSNCVQTVGGEVAVSFGRKAPLEGISFFQDQIGSTYISL